MDSTAYALLMELPLDIVTEARSDSLRCHLLSRQ